VGKVRGERGEVRKSIWPFGSFGHFPGLKVGVLGSEGVHELKIEDDDEDENEDDWLWKWLARV
jgi:hypothetical protein